MNIEVFADENLDDEPVVVTRFEGGILVLSPNEARSLAELLISVANIIDYGNARLH